MHSLDIYFLHASLNSPIHGTKLTCKWLSSQHQQLHLHGKGKSYLAFGSSKVIAKTQCNPVDTTFVWPKTCGYTDKMAV